MTKKIFTLDKLQKRYFDYILKCKEDEKDNLSFIEKNIQKIQTENIQSIKDIIEELLRTDKVFIYIFE